jgi:DNA-binding transcriptional LysR family regulator
VLTSGSLEVIRSLVASGAGAGILPGRVASGARLKAVPGSPKHSDTLYLAYRADVQNSLAARSIGQALEKALT